VYLACWETSCSVVGLVIEVARTDQLFRLTLDQLTERGTVSEASVSICRTSKFPQLQPSLWQPDRFGSHQPQSLGVLGLGTSSMERAEGQRIPLAVGEQLWPPGSRLLRVECIFPVCLRASKMRNPTPKPTVPIPDEAPFRRPIGHREH
jgi:hypothetical protein